MKIAVVGKGGSGKTTTSGTISRLFARKGKQVIALDCDSNPNLGLSIGLSIEETERLVSLRQALDEENGEHAPSVPEILQRFGTAVSANLQMAVVSRIDQYNPG